MRGRPGRFLRDICDSKGGGGVGENIGDVGKTVGENLVNDGEAKEFVLKMIAHNNKVSASEIAKVMSVTQRTVERYIGELREEGHL